MHFIYGVLILQLKIIKNFLRILKLTHSQSSIKKLFATLIAGIVKEENSKYYISNSDFDRNLIISTKSFRNVHNAHLGSDSKTLI